MTEAERYLEEKLQRAAAAAQQLAGRSETAASAGLSPGASNGALPVAGPVAVWSSGVSAKAGWFTAAGRLNRMSFFLRILALCPLYVVGASMDRFGAKEWVPIALMVIIAVSVMQILQAIKRLHDFGMSGWFVLVPQVPAAIAEIWKFLFWSSKMGSTNLIAVVVICAGLSLVGTLWIQFAPGTAGPNRFGSQPI